MELVRWRTVIRGVTAIIIIIWGGCCGTSGGTDCHASSYRTSTIPIAPSTTVIRATVAAPDCDVTNRAAHRSPAITPDSGSTAIWMDPVPQHHAARLRQHRHVDLPQPAKHQQCSRLPSRGLTQRT